jgi:hypothetical protein
MSNKGKMMTLLKDALNNPLKTAFSENISQLLQATAIVGAGLVLVGIAAVFAFHSGVAAFG